MNYLYKTAFILITFISILSSCKKFVEIPPPPNQLETAAVFSDSTSATAAIRGIYIAMMQNFAFNLTNGGSSVYPAMSADELIPTSKNIDEEDIYNNSLIPLNSINESQLWNQGYKLLYMVNASIEGLANSKVLQSSLKTKLSAEAYFIRAFINFYLVNYYGGIPLPVTSDYRVNMSLPRGNIDSVYNLILRDLDYANKNLPVNYPSPGRYRPNIFTAKALLARVLLYRGRWAESEKEATEIINSGSYTLETDLNRVFTINSNESIWNLAAVVEGKETWEGYFFLPSNSSVIPKYILNDNLLNAFETSDKRKNAWTNKNTVNGITYFYPFKYKLRSTTTTPLETYVVFRLAELYLVRAEALAMQNNLTAALSDLNMIRKRAGLSNLPTNLNKEQILSAISQERRVELFIEWAHRWFDLKRTGNAITVLRPLKPSLEESDLLYPIPSSQLETNPYLLQNPGY